MANRNAKDKNKFEKDKEQEKGKLNEWKNTKTKVGLLWIKWDFYILSVTGAGKICLVLGTADSAESPDEDPG